LTKYWGIIDLRKLGEKLKLELLAGDKAALLRYIKSNAKLRLEVRRNNNAFVYYRKAKVLEIKGLKIDSKYGSVPNPTLALSSPKILFRTSSEMC
jgi:hypothetical protein